MKGTQKQRLLDYLKGGRPIDPLTSWRTLGIYRLAPRILDLKRDGHYITTKMVDRTNLYGEGVKVAEYRLEVMA